MPKKVYAVRAGRACGIFTTWEECKKQVDGYAGARYKGFTDIAEALAWLNGGDRPAPPQRPSASPRRSPRPRPASSTPTRPDSEQDSVIYTDGSCLRNPDGSSGGQQLSEVRGPNSRGRPFSYCRS